MCYDPPMHCALTHQQMPWLGTTVCDLAGLEMWNVVNEYHFDIQMHKVVTCFKPTSITERDPVDFFH